MSYLYRLVKLGAIILPFLAIICEGCQKFVQINPPSTRLVTASVFDNSTTATAAQTAIYSKMASNSESWNMSQDCGLMSDELTSYSNNALQLGYFTNSLAALNNPGPWANAYNYIYQANAIIEGLQNNSGNVYPAIEQQLIGESEFLRAFWFFYLTSLYGDIPLVTSTAYNSNGVMARTSKTLVYQQIVADLADAQNLLNANFVDGTDTTITTERVRPTKAAATALLARVYLYIQKYDSAEAEATNVINNTLFSLCTKLSGTAGAVFLKNSTEAIWQLSTPVPSNWNTSDGEFFILKSAPSTTGTNNSAAISSQLINTFEPGDLRKSQWIGRYTAPGVSYSFPYKYQSYGVAVTASGVATEYVMVLRLAEQYLIRAEARAQQGNIAGAQADLNVIRIRAGLAPYAGASDKTSLLNAILHERQVELFSEWGHRWFDLIRTGAVDSVMGGSNGVCKAKGGSWISNWEVMPIPQNDRTNDPNLTQNSGY